MPRRQKQLGELGAMDLLEEALHLLRRAPPATWAAYGLGAVPFALGLLYFWADMSQSGDAFKRHAVAALGMTLLFLWLKAWQTVFCRRLMEQFACLPAEPWNLRRLASLITQQGSWQPTAFAALPLAALVALPLAWMIAFYQNLTVLADGRQPSLRAAASLAWSCACAWPRQNHLLLSLLTGLGLMVALNWISAFFVLPYLLKAWLGIETLFSRSSDAYLNSTFAAVILVLSWLALDPLIKAAYTLRCFHALARTSGEDLKAGLRRLQSTTLPLALLLVCWLPSAATAADTHPSGDGLVPATELDHAIDRVLQQREFISRVPKDLFDRPEEGVPLLKGFLEGIGETLSDWWDGVAILFKKFENWLDNLFGKRRLPTWRPDAGQMQTDWLSPLRVLLLLLLVFCVVLAARFLIRWHRQRQKIRAATAVAESPPTRPDLREEDVSASQLPEDEWRAMAHDLAARGEWRLAVRALYLAALAALAQREMLAIARFKSNHDYLRELARRAHGFPGLLELFQQVIWDYERIWYGRHEATPGLCQDYEQRLERLRNL